MFSHALRRLLVLIDLVKEIGVGLVCFLLVVSCNWYSLIANSLTILNILLLILAVSSSKNLPEALGSSNASGNFSAGDKVARISGR